MSAPALQRRLDNLVLELKGLVYVRALLETHGASTTEIEAHSNRIDVVRDELARFAKVHAEAGRL